MTFGNPQACKQQAREYFRLADAAATPAAKAEFVELALRWLTLAADDEGAEQLLQQWGLPPFAQNRSAFSRRRRQWQSPDRCRSGRPR